MRSITVVVGTPVVYTSQRLKMRNGRVQTRGHFGTEVTA